VSNTTEVEGGEEEAVVMKVGSGEDSYDCMISTILFTGDTE
jgi:hypothetical protein